MTQAINQANTNPISLTQNDGSLLKVRDLVKYFPIKAGLIQRVTNHVRAVDHVSFSVQKGRVLGVVGESGCGKTTLGRTVLRLTPSTSGTVIFDGKDVFAASKSEMKQLRTDMQIVFQDPYSSLNPRLPVYDIIGEALTQHHLVKDKTEMMDKVVEMVQKCGLFPEQVYRYPHQFSGGQRQRICIARALVLNPKFVVCDETVSALDVSIQSQIINLLKEMQEDMGLTYLFISHDLSVIRFISDEVGVMYLGEMVEYGSKRDIFDHPVHPYTEALLSAAPTFDFAHMKTKKRILLQGDIPSPVNPPPGCRFHTRCPYATALCGEAVPEAVQVSDSHWVRCHLAKQSLRQDVSAQA